MAMDEADDLLAYRLRQVEDEVRGPHGIVARMERRMDGMERKLTWILGVLLVGTITALVSVVAHL